MSDPKSALLLTVRLISLVPIPMGLLELTYHLSVTRVANAFRSRGKAYFLRCSLSLTLDRSYHLYKRFTTDSLHKNLNCCHKDFKYSRVFREANPHSCSNIFSVDLTEPPWFAMQVCKEQKETLLGSSLRVFTGWRWQPLTYIPWTGESWEQATPSTAPRSAHPSPALCSKIKTTYPQ